jgi:exonuclease I
MLNHQTKEKIIRIKESIKNKVDVREIEKKFFNTKKKKNDFLTKNLQYFITEELEYINAEDELIDKVKKLYNQVSELDEKETTENNVIEGTKTEEDLKSNSVSKLDKALQLPEEFNYFKDKENLKKLIEMVEKYKNHIDVEVIEAGKIEIPLEVRDLKMDGNIAVKSNLALYEELKELAYINKIGIGQVVTLAIWEFLKRHK